MKTAEKVNVWWVWKTVLILLFGSNSYSHEISSSNTEHRSLNKPVQKNQSVKVPPVSFPLSVDAFSVIGKLLWNLRESRQEVEGLGSHANSKQANSNILNNSQKKITK